MDARPGIWHEGMAWFGLNAVLLKDINVNNFMPVYGFPFVFFFCSFSISLSFSLLCMRIFIAFLFCFNVASLYCRP